MMTQYRWLILAAYPVVGLVLGLADPWLGRLVQQLGTKPGVATAVSVNLLLPAMAVAFGLAHARLWAVWVGAAAMTIAFATGLAVQYSAGVRDWSAAAVLGSIPPVLVVAAFGYAVLGTLAALAIQSRGRLRTTG